MKKLFIFLCVIGLILSVTSPLFGGGADNKTNWSVEYIRTLNRLAATDSADIVMYNPAGVMKMEDGLYGNVSAHYILKDYNNKISGVDFDQDEPSVVPGLFAVYKKDRWAGFFGVSNVVGGGKVEFKSGNATTNTLGLGILSAANTALAAAAVPPMFWYTGISSQNLNAEQIGLGYTLGGAFKINEVFSVSLAARFVDSTREVSGSATVSATTPLPPFNNDIVADVDYEEDADGWGFVIGLNISPIDELNIGIHFDSQVDLDFDQKIITDTRSVLSALGVTSGGVRTRNLPAILAAGVSYQLNPKIRVETGITYYLNEDADFVDIAGTSKDESDVDNGFDLGITLEYAFTEKVKASVGYLYTTTGVDVEDMTPELPELDANTIGAGVAWEVIPNLDLNFGIGHVFYDSESFVSSTTGQTIEYEKDITFLAFGVQYKFF